MSRDALAAAYAHGPGKRIAVGPAPQPRTPEGPRIPLRALEDQAVARLLIDVLTPQRWEQWNQYNDHRAYPSPRSAYLVDIAVVQGSQRWLLDPARRALIGTRKPEAGELTLELVPRPDKLSEGYGEFRDALVDLEAGHVLEALVRHAPGVGLTATATATFDRVTLTPGTATPVQTTPRTSGLGPRGLSADPRPLPHSMFHNFVSEIGDALWHRLAVHNVEGLQDGWYHHTTLIEPCDATAQVQQTYGHPRANTDVTSMNLVLVLTADIPEAVATNPNGYRELLRTAGRTGQRLAETAAAQGMFCRPVRSVEDPALEAVVHAPPNHSLLYVLLAGRQRIHCFPYDLTPLEAL